MVLHKAGLALGLALAVPVVASAVTVNELRAQIEDLLRQVRILQQQLVNQGEMSASEQNPFCLILERTLLRGSLGDDVTRLQRVLVTDSSIYPEGKVTGYFGPLTERAVARLQVRVGITGGDGIVGPRTRAFFRNACVQVLPTAYSTQPTPAPPPAVPEFPPVSAEERQETVSPDTTPVSSRIQLPPTANFISVTTEQSTPNLRQ